MRQERRLAILTMQSQAYFPSHPNTHTHTHTYTRDNSWLLTCSYLFCFFFKPMRNMFNLCPVKQITLETVVCKTLTKRQLIGNDPDAGENWGQEEKGKTEDKMVDWHHWLNGHEFEQTLGDSEGQGGLACCSSWSQTWLSNWTATSFLIQQFYPQYLLVRLTIYLICRMFLELILTSNWFPHRLIS